MALLMHPLRQRIVSEMHLRRMPALRPPCQLMQVVRLVSEAERSEESSWLLSLVELDGTVGGVFPRHARGTTSDGGTWLWERHSEASTCTILSNVTDASTFSQAAFPEALVTWLERAPGLVIRAVKILVAADDDAVDQGSLRLDPDDLISCRHNNARLWSDFRVHEDGWGRLVVAANATHPADLGRLVQRVQELGNYRNLALLALPEVQARVTDLDRLESALVEISIRLADTEGEQTLLDEISRLSAETAALTASTAFRIGAMDAYSRIVEDRLRELNCTRIDGFQRLDDFIGRRLTPATRTCQAFAGRLEALASRLERATALLRTRIEMRAQAQNTELLNSLDRTSARQLRLQHLVEGLSVVAVSYYALGLVGYLLKPTAHRFSLSVEWLQAASVPAVVFLVWLFLRLRIKRIGQTLSGHERSDA